MNMNDVLLYRIELSGCFLDDISVKDIGMRESNKEVVVIN